MKFRSRFLLAVVFAGALGLGYWVQQRNGNSELETTVRMIEQVIDQTEPYERGVSYKDFTVGAIVESMPANFFDGIDADGLAGWAEQEFARLPRDAGRERDRAFLALDIAAIASEAREFKPLIEQRKRTTREVYRQIESARPATQVTLHKLYNEGTVIRGPGSTIGVDIVLHPDNDDLSAGFAKLLDALFISHVHGDHNDQASTLHSELKKAGKPIILPKDNDAVPIGGVLDSGTIGTAVWTALRGRHVQIDRPSSFFHFKLGGRTIAHSGDNTRWMGFASSEFAKNLDVLMLKPENLYLHQDTAEGIQHLQAAMEESLGKIRPRIVIPHHLLELGHGLGAYGHGMALKLYSQVPEGTRVQMLHWGESLVLDIE